MLRKVSTPGPGSGGDGPRCAASPAAGRARAAGRAGEEPRPRSRLRGGPGRAALPSPGLTRGPRASLPALPRQRRSEAASWKEACTCRDRAAGPAGCAARRRGRPVCVGAGARRRGRGRASGRASPRPVPLPGVLQAGRACRGGEVRRFSWWKSMSGGLHVCFLNARCCHQVKVQARFSHVVSNDYKNEIQRECSTDVKFVVLLVRQLHR